MLDHKNYNHNGARYRRAEYRNCYGELFVLTYDAVEDIGLLSGDEFGEESLDILNDYLPRDLLLEYDERQALHEAWQRLTGRPFKKRARDKLIERLTALLEEAMKK